MGSAISGHLAEALQYLKAALTLLDAHDAPAHIGAHVDLGICHLKEHLETESVLLDGTDWSSRTSLPLRN
ncbi:hypothetical protein G7077_08085 [Sphingomonas piscis]|uniref:Uncharacterized protein n=1 Tax=Sphingomonas piscis TaxID=2714943 RepID=A0A6G7YQ48_9SPHN|nr:hypothetical protein [Sphingomonas piscis]QIK78859.1 hypothetical protein G7077_08085 [Sphingomonas piscis]